MNRVTVLSGHDWVSHSVLVPSEFQPTFERGGGGSQDIFSLDSPKRIEFPVNMRLVSPAAKLLKDLFYESMPAVFPLVQFQGRNFNVTSDDFKELLGNIFGGYVSPALFSKFFLTSKPHFYLARLELQKSNHMVQIEGAYGMIGFHEYYSFKYEIELAKTKVGYLVGANASDCDEMLKMRGVGRERIMNFLAFCYFLGCCEMQLSATLDGKYVWPHLGFDYDDHNDFDVVRRELLEFLRVNEVSLERSEKQKIIDARYAWELADFTVGGVNWGRRLLLENPPVKSARMSFKVDATYPGWKQLIKT